MTRWLEDPYSVGADVQVLVLGSLGHHVYLLVESFYLGLMFVPHTFHFLVVFSRQVVETVESDLDFLFELEKRVVDLLVVVPLCEFVQFIEGLAWFWNI